MEIGAIHDEILGAGMMDARDLAPVIIIDDDEMFRNTIGMNLEDEGFEVLSFSNGPEALSYFNGNGEASVVLLDWRMPEMDGSEVLRIMRDAGHDVPIIMLTSLTEQFYEEVALERGATDFVDKSRSFGIISRRIRLVTEGGKASAPQSLEPSDATMPRRSKIGPLELRHDSCGVLWCGREVGITISEYKVIELLATNAGQDVPYRRIYDVARGAGLIAAYGEQGQRSNVRSIIKRLRKKFKAIDDGFAEIENYPGFGYRWRGEEAG